MWGTDASSTLVNHSLEALFYYLLPVLTENEQKPVFHGSTASLYF